MKTKWVSIVDELRGNVDERHYVRQISGNEEWGAVCSKPEMSEERKGDE